MGGRSSFIKYAVVALAAAIIGSYSPKIKVSVDLDKLFPIEIVRSNIAGTLDQRATEYPLLGKPFLERTLEEVIQDYEDVTELQKQAKRDLENQRIKFTRKSQHDDLESSLESSFAYIRQEFPPSFRMVTSTINFGKLTPGFAADHHYSDDGLSVIRVSESPDVISLQAIVAHEAAHAQNTLNETDASVLAIELLSARAADGDLLAKAALLQKIQGNLYEYILKRSYEDGKFDLWFVKVNRGAVFGDLKSRLDRTLGDVVQKYDIRPLVAVMSAANGEGVTYTGSQASRDYIWDEKEGPRTYYLDSSYNYLGRMLAGFRENRTIAQQAFSEAMVRFRKRQLLKAEENFKIAAEKASKTGEATSIFGIADTSVFYLADIAARKGDYKQAAGLIKNRSIEGTPEGVNKAIFILKHESEKAALQGLEMSFEDQFQKTYTLEEAIDDYLRFKGLRIDAEKRLRAKGIDPHAQIQGQDELEELLAGILPYVWRQFNGERTETRIRFMGVADYNEMKEGLKELGRTMQSVIGKREGEWTIEINPEIQIHDAIEAISYAAIYAHIYQPPNPGQPQQPFTLSTMASRASRENQLLSWQTLADRALETNLLAQYELMGELESAAFNFSYRKARLEGKRDIWREKAIGGEFADFDFLDKVAFSEPVMKYEIDPYLPAIRTITGDTAGKAEHNGIKLGALKEVFNR